ncbi:uncharacterized protein BO72DRAFT_477000 [Aspergillus fijiensis CBS 313.89]|uniref:ubiquitinyl hydrolase 1 n=1 Tax=Aspergillus fijiensis CBS 313.89 TaxID=1448319 RepID=A0A8G1W2H3_9EURO|nr:uncharacterized protein BO72DRAFT_477000 [Aspergillus fijiensis CBS 313.89]RAK78064.1 hypothetical protein BO72DRAFT_477000 [Aspergillus fijiensis CBS 313.89]
MYEKNTLIDIFHHVALPPQLPGSPDTEPQKVDYGLIERLRRAVRNLRHYAEDDTTTVWKSLDETLKECRAINDGRVHKAALVSAFQRLGPDHPIIVHVVEHNAALLFHQAHVAVEAFEASPSAEPTIAAPGALQWDFPGVAISLDKEEFDKPSLQESMGEFLERASTEPLDEFTPKSQKAGVKVTETRDTMDPDLITDFLITPVLLRKRIKDDVCWNNAERPWRRSPLWLVLRVCLQRLLYLRLGSELADLLRDLVESRAVGPEQWSWLRAKLCRRLTKLETMKDSLCPESQAAYTRLANQLEPFYTEQIEIASSGIEQEWHDFKKNFLRKVPKLPLRAGAAEMHLSLPNSISYLRNILQQPHDGNPRSRNTNLVHPASKASADMTDEFTTLFKVYSSLAELEQSIDSGEWRAPAAGLVQSIGACTKIADRIEDYLQRVAGAYDRDPEQFSLLILNIFELWVYMDKCATVAYPLLLEFHPVFRPELLDVLLLSRRTDLDRLHAIQLHLHGRCATVADSSVSIFADPAPGCFADRYMELDVGKSLRELQKAIEDASQASSQRKLKELQKVNRKFESLTTELSSSDCTQRKNPDGTHDIRDCSHCYYNRSRKSLEISAHEAYLPCDGKMAEKRAIVFELETPEAFAAYRSATWHLIVRFGPRLASPNAMAPMKLLSEYANLSGYFRENARRGGLSLASTTKSFLDTHYKLRQFPIAEESVLLPSGLTFKYYDKGRNVWGGDLPKTLTFAHHFALALPSNLPLAQLYSSSSFAPDGPGPSSYEALAESRKRPSAVTLHEFLAHQSLMAGKQRRWISILSELGSSNINFSAHETMALLQHLALQAGPWQQRESLRVIHSVFHEAVFCKRLIQQIDQHVSLITSNWREVMYMETMLTLTMRVCSLGCDEVSRCANELLLKIRSVTHRWIHHLRNEARKAVEVDVADRTARYCFLAALLCRRTFDRTTSASIDAASTQTWIEATLSMQESLVIDASNFDAFTRRMLVRDIKMSNRLCQVIQFAVRWYPSSVNAAIDRVWFSAREGQHTIWQQEENGWITATARGTDEERDQYRQLHILEGHFLIDGKPLGKLPADIRNSDVLKELFGNERLSAFPSSLPGMSYKLALARNGYEVHLGYRGQDLVIWACKESQTLEHVPRSVFGSGKKPDLPYSLLRDCVHWINIKTGILQARRIPQIWRERPGDWKINIRTQQANRRKSYLVDPRSQLAMTIASIFSHFEKAAELTIYQPPQTMLSVELKAMNLRFYVNQRQRLQCTQLSAEIDPNQDAGTLYGLQSMLVLRNIYNRSQRSIIVPVGSIQIERQGIHVLVKKENNGNYGRYQIDGVLGRLHCPAEPLLLYTKAQLHAFTSFVSSDPLTGRTGTEEALACLKSASSLPWRPLESNIVDLLRGISGLTPVQQMVRWNKELTVSIQHEAYQPTIESILKRSQRLSLFQPGIPPRGTNTSGSQVYLRDRALWRRSLYERSDTWNEDKVQEIADEVYVSRARYRSSTRAKNVREIVSLLRERPSEIATTDHLAHVIQRWGHVGGYDGKFIPSTVKAAISIDLAANWGRLVRLCAESQTRDVHYLMFNLGLIAYSQNVSMTALRVLAAFVTLDELKKLRLPQHEAFEQVRENGKPDSRLLLELVEPALIKFTAPTPVKRPKNSTTCLKAAAMAEHERAKEEHESQCNSESQRLVTFILSQWPCLEPSLDGFSSEFVNVMDALDLIKPVWSRRYKNMQLLAHIEEVQKVLNTHGNVRANRPQDSPASGHVEYFESRSGSHPRVAVELGRDLLHTPGPPLAQAEHHHQKCAKKKPHHPTDPRRRRGDRPVSTGEIDELESIVRSMINSDCPVRSRYGRDLQVSIHALKDKDQEPNKSQSPKLSYWKGLERYKEEIRDTQDVVDSHYRQIHSALLAGDSRLYWLLKGNIAPCITTVTILQQLRGSLLQRLLRIREFFARRDESRLDQEYCQRDHAVWDYMRYSDWILVEIDANMQIRQEQVTVALEMITPTSGSNSVLQMNMGQGKTSVITPMVACALANGKILARLLTHIGGLVGREVLHIPFSRRTFHENTLRQSGIILGVPEHALSFKLSGLQRVSDVKIAEATEMVAIQKWIDRHGRDILDECDFTLAVKTQLIYPSGSQLVVDGYPDRWEVTMNVLGLVADHLRDLAREFPRSIDVIEREDVAFPIAYLLRNDVELALMKRVVNDACRGAAEIEAVRIFLSDPAVDDSVTKSLQQIFENKPQTLKRMYLLRGLLVHQILLLCLKKRWNVQYGLHPDRDPIAVLFHAKGVPSNQAEWGHPDVAILFTCLAFYHEGLSQEQCRQCLEAVLRADDPATEYDRWTETSAIMPESLRHWNLINVNDYDQGFMIWQHLRFSTTVINYYLKNFVFPVHAKQFAIKLQMSGWDVPYFRNSPEISDGTTTVQPGLTTGFSGTNDNRRLLPLTMKQHDLPELSHTNAEVLTYLLQKRNREYRAAVFKGKRMSETELLCSLTKTEVRTLIDAGAFVLEMDNLSLVKTWLMHDNDAQAAVYFGPDNQPWVCSRTGKCLPLIATPYADDMTDCLIYLDQAHTRGTDLKLPAHARGALTLGLNQTKDHTVQAAMRLRQLGTTQSVVFIAPPEVHHNILDVCGKHQDEQLDSSDVVYWLLHQTCASNRDLEPLYNAQGVDFCRRIQAAEDYPNFIKNHHQRRYYMGILQQPEQQSLEQLYKPEPTDASDGDSDSSNDFTYSGRAASFIEVLRQRRTEGKDIHHSAIASSAQEEVEQEREVAYEVEEEREVERPKLLTAYIYPGLHQSLSQFGKTGSLEGVGYVTAESMILATKLGGKYRDQVGLSLPHLYVSVEFTKTVKLKPGEKMDELTRPVNWLLCNIKTEMAIVVTPEEAEDLIPILRTEAAPSMHLMTYAAPVTRRMQHFSNLDYYTVPPLPVANYVPAFLAFEVGIFAGRLYFGPREYEEILDRLALEWDDVAGSAVTPAEGSSLNMAFLQEWLALRRQGQDISHTPMGYVCQGRRLRSDHPFFVESDTRKTTDSFLPSSGKTVSFEEQEEYSDSNEGVEDEAEQIDLGVEGDEDFEEDEDFEGEI